MKAVITSFLLFSGIFSASAQQVTPLATIQANSNELNPYAIADAQFVNNNLELNNESFNDLFAIFYNKYKLLSQDNSPQTIQNISTMVTNRLQAILPSSKYTQLSQIEGAIEKLSGLIYLNSH